MLPNAKRLLRAISRDGAGLAMSLRRIARVADDFLEQAEQAERDYYDFLDLFAELGVACSPRVPKACAGVLLRDPVRLHASRRGPDALVQSNVAHEGGHYVRAVLCPDEPQDEATADALGLFVRVPRASARRALREEGFDLAALVARYPRMAPSEVVLRFALHAGGAALVRSARTRYVIGVDGATGGDDEADGEWGEDEPVPDPAVQVDLDLFGLRTSSLWQSLYQVDVSGGPVGVSHRGMSGIAFRDPGAGNPRITAIVMPAEVSRGLGARVLAEGAAENDVAAWLSAVEEA
jgi:hypothetical protein